MLAGVTLLVGYTESVALTRVGRRASFPHGPAPRHTKIPRIVLIVTVGIVIALIGFVAVVATLVTEA